jgi:hypothetical protein
LLLWLQVLDRLRPGWQSLAYFHDVVQLATAAAAAAQQQQQAGQDVLAADIGLKLLQEKHSIFYERCVAGEARMLASYLYHQRQVSSNGEH